MDKKNKEKISEGIKLLYCFFGFPAIISFLSIVYFWVIYLSLTHPILSAYQNNLGFKLGLLNAAIGFVIILIIITWKSLSFVFGENKE